MRDTPKIYAAAREAAAEAIKRKVTDSEPLLSSGLIDSLALLKLISRLERKLGFTIPTDDIQPDDFDTIDLMVETIHRVVPES